MGKYEEALERAKQGLPMDEIFPELKENEDERIRRKMVEHFKSKTKETWCNMPVKDIIAYLEKRKEQKAALYWHKIKANDHLPCKAYIYKFAYEQENNFHGRTTINGYLVPNEPVTIGCDTWYLPVEDIKNLPKEEELDTVSPKKTVEQKPFIIHDTGCSKRGTKMPEYCLNVKPAEWSEEDEKIIQSLILEVNKYVFFAGIEANKIVSFLKSLRPQPHWKPSKEQMEALNSIILTGSFTYVGQVQDLISLKNDIKSL